MKKERITRTVAFAAAAVMALTACGSVSAAADETAGETVVSGNGAGYDWILNNIPKLSDEKVSFTLVVCQESVQNDYNTMQFWEALEEATNVHIDFTCIMTGDTYTQQKNLMLASGVDADGFFGPDALSMSDLNAYGPMGVFIAVDDLIEEYCPNYKARLEETPTLDGLSTCFDDNKYSWGTVNATSARDYPDNLYINKTWLDNLGLEVPTTMEEYYEVLKAFKEQDANGNGDPTDEIPYTFTAHHHIQGYGGFFGAYGRAEAFNGSETVLDHYVVEDDTVVYEPITEEYKTAIIELRKFVEDGLWDEEGFVQTNDQFIAKCSTETAMVGSMYCWSLAEFPTADEYIAIKPLKATADSEDASVHKRQNHISVQGTGLSITSSCENPEILAQWVDLFYTDELSILAYYGTERVTEIDEDGNFYYDESDAEDGTAFASYVRAVAPYDGSPKYLTEEIRTKCHVESAEDLKAEVIEEYYIDAPASVTLPTMNFTNEENDWLQNYGLAISQYVMECQSNWLLGRSDIEEDWDSYLETLETMQLQEYIDMMQTAYDRTIGK